MRKFLHNEAYSRTLNFVVLFISNEYLIVSKGYTLYYYYPKTSKLISFSRLNDKKNAFISRFRLMRRLMRAEIRALYHFKDDNWICIAKKGIFRYSSKTGLFEKCCDIEKGSRPMNLCQDKDGNIYYGEYCYNPERKPMRIFRSVDNGETWEVAFEFKNGEINHIHGIFYDPYSERLWVATGDDDISCIFGYTSDGFRTFVKEYSGSQQYRVCVPLFTEDEIIFATDSQHEQNYIRSINRETGEVRNLQKIQGSGIYAVKNDKMMMISTTVEPSKVNKDSWSHLWYSKDGHTWMEYTSYKKDYLPMRLFQFGSIRFPNYEAESEFIAINGRALQKLDQRSMLIKFIE